MQTRGGRIDRRLLRDDDGMCNEPDILVDVVDVVYILSVDLIS